MDTETRPSVHVAAALFAALDFYGAWLSGLSEDAGSQGADAGTGQKALHQVLKIRRESFPHLTQDATALLVVHTEIATLLYERELRATRGTTAGNSDELAQCAALVQRQLEAIGLLRRAVAPPEFD
jgi:hypothetical protein